MNYVKQNNLKTPFSVLTFIIIIYPQIFYVLWRTILCGKNIKRQRC